MKQTPKTAAIFAILCMATSLAAEKPHDAAPQAQGWVSTWGASQQIPEPQNALAPDYLRDATVRQIFHVSLGGPRVRVHLSNAFGIVPLRFTSVHIARPVSSGSSAIEPGSDKPLTFDGKPDVTIPPGAEYVSDPIDFSVAPLSDVTVTYHLDQPPAWETSHPGSRETTWYTHGNMVSALDLPGAQKVEHWYQVTEIDVPATPGVGVVVALGDSITDGHATTTNGNDRWTDVLAARLQASPSTQEIGVSNQGIGGNHLLSDGLGPNVLARFDRDVLAPAGVKWVIVFEGVNDIGSLGRFGNPPAAAHDALVERMIGAYRQIIDRAHDHGLLVYGATITPFGGSFYARPGGLPEEDRQKVNDWIRTPGNFDAVIDFDAVVRDPAHPDRLLPAYDSGDHLHPGPAGYKAMGDAIPLTLFAH